MPEAILEDLGDRLLRLTLQSITRAQAHRQALALPEARSRPVAFRKRRQELQTLRLEILLRHAERARLTEKKVLFGGGFLGFFFWN